MWIPTTRPVSWVSIDWEWYAAPGALPVPRILTAIESATGRVHRIGERELKTLHRPPFELGPDVVVCSYSIAADLVPWLVKGWPLPDRVVCTYAETRVRYNGVRSEFDDDLIGACARRGIAYAEARETKDYWHQRFQDPRPFGPEEEEPAADYCLADTAANLKLAQDYESDMWWERALQYGEYCKSAAIIEHNGVSVYARPLSLFRKHHEAARLALIEEGDRALAGFTRQVLIERGDPRAQSGLDELGCYDKGHLRNKRIWAFAQAHEIPWPATACGGPVTANDELKIMGARFPVVEQFRQLRKTVGALRSNKYAAGPDGRSHTSLHPFGTKTGRNAPKGSLSIWMGPAWMRGFMRAGPGRALIYLDYVAEEFAIKMAQSDDQAGIRAYQSGDPYMATGILMGLAPTGASKHTHPNERALCKVLVLALGYGMTAYGLSRRLGIEEGDAIELIARYDAVYSVSKAWSEGMAAHARAHRRIVTPFGWEMHVTRSTEPRTLLNWPVQSLAADLLRFVSIVLVSEGFTVCGLIHDAVLLECRIDEIQDVVGRATALMTRASEQVVGTPLRVDAGSEDEPHIFPYPARFRDKREGDMFRRALRLLEEIEHERKSASIRKAYGKAA